MTPEVVLIIMKIRKTAVNLTVIFPCRHNRLNMNAAAPLNIKDISDASIPAGLKTGVLLNNPA